MKTPSVGTKMRPGTPAAGIILGTGLGKAAVEPVGRAVLADTYPSTSWSRVFAVHSAASPLGNVIGPILAGTVALAVSGDEAWRWAFPVLALPSFVALVATRRLREVDDRGDAASGSTWSDLRLGAAVARILRIPTFARQTAAIGVLGFALVGQGRRLEVRHSTFRLGSGVVRASGAFESSIDWFWQTRQRRPPEGIRQRVRAPWKGAGWQWNVARAISGVSGTR